MPGRKTRSKLRWLEHDFGVLCPSFTKLFIFPAVLSRCQKYAVSQGSAVGSIFVVTCSWSAGWTCSSPKSATSQVLQPPLFKTTLPVHEHLLASLLPCASVIDGGISIHKLCIARLLLMHWIPTNFARQFNKCRWH